MEAERRAGAVAITEYDLLKQADPARLRFRFVDSGDGLSESLVYILIRGGRIYRVLAGPGGRWFFKGAGGVRLSGSTASLKELIEPELNGGYYVFEFRSDFDFYKWLLYNPD